MAKRSFPQAICHLDCNSFFASVEMAYNPKIKDKPVLVGGIGGGCVITANYLARDRGVYTGMPVFQAKKLCPDGVFLHGDFRRYHIYNRKILSILKTFTPDIEELSIDEFYFDLTGLRRIYHCSYEEICERIKNKIHSDLGITVSIGLSINKTWSKVGSNYKKPNAVTTISAKDIEDFQQKIPLKAINGIGSNTSRLLEKFNIRTIPDLISKPPSFIEKILGKPGLELYQELQGDYIKILNFENAAPKSLSRTRSFKCSQDKNYIYSQIIKNLSIAFWELRRYQLKTKQLYLMLRLKNFKVLNYEITLDQPTNHDNILLKKIKETFDKVYSKNEIYRSTGIITTKLIPEENVQFNLFTDFETEKTQQTLFDSLDKINNKYGRQTLTFASATNNNSPRLTLENLSIPYLGETIL